MKKWIIGLMLALIVTSGMAFTVSTQVMAEKPICELYAAEFSETLNWCIADQYQDFTPIEIGILSEPTTQLSSTKEGVSWVNESTLKEAFHSLPIPIDNKNVVVEDSDEITWLLGIVPVADFIRHN